MDMNEGLSGTRTIRKSAWPGDCIHLGRRRNSLVESAARSASRRRAQTGGAHERHDPFRDERADRNCENRFEWTDVAAQLAARVQGVTFAVFLPASTSIVTEAAL